MHKAKYNANTAIFNFNSTFVKIMWLCTYIARLWMNSTFKKSGWTLKLDTNITLKTKIENKSKERSKKKLQGKKKFGRNVRNL